MSKNRFYAIRFQDGKKAIFDDWPSCKEAVHGAKGAAYKGFPTREEALAFLEAGGEQGKDPAGVAVYVDGSYRDGIYSYGFAVLGPDQEVLHTQKGRGEDPEAARLRNVSGEMKGAMEAVRWCQRQGHRSLTLFYDYSGIEKWARGEWKRNNPYTRSYYDFMAKKQQELDIRFAKVRGHSGDVGNDLADRLAKEGLEG